MIELPSLPRFWVPDGAAIALMDRGFIADPTNRIAAAWIPDAGPFERFAETSCTVLMGEPGLGKTTALRHESGRLESAGEATHMVDLSSTAEESRLRERIFDAPEWRRWIEGNHRLHLFLDTLDFALLRVETVVELLQDGLDGAPLDRLTLRLACRTAERPRDLEAWLKERFGSSAFGVLELLPLRYADVLSAAEHVLGEAAGFVDAVLAQELQPLAMTPVTLRMLLKTALDQGGLPSSRLELYERGCLALAEEVGEPRRRARQLRASLTGTQRLAVAERISGLLTLSAHPAVTPDASNFDDEALTPHMLAGGVEANRALGIAGEFEIDEPAIRDALRCGLFTNAGSGRLHFAHQTYGEFLCGRWLAARFAPEQLDDLLFAGTDAGLRIVPQLRATAGWVASFSSAFAQSLLRRDPAALLRADLATTSADERSLAVEALFSAIAGYELRRFDLPVRLALPHLAHPGLGAQVRAVLTNDHAPAPLREIAADLAAVCRVVAVEGVLVDLALDQSVSTPVRTAAVSALGEFATAATRRKLIPLATEPLDADDDDELKGVALSAVWPEILPLADLLPAITTPKRGSLYGCYKRFLRSEFLGAVPDEQLSTVLDHARAWPCSWSESRGVLLELRQRLLVRGCGLLEDEAICAAVAQLVLPVLASSSDLVDRSDADEFGDFLNGSEGRRLLTTHLVNLESFDVHGGALVGSAPPLVRPEDIDWVVDELISSVDGPRERAWAEMVEALLASNLLEVDVMTYDARQQSPMLRDLTSYRYDAVELDSTVAATMRDRHSRWSQMAEAREERERPPFDVRQKAAGAIGLWEQGDTDGYWAVLGWLEQVDRGHSSFATSDPRLLPGWTMVDESVRQFVVGNAAVYLDQASPQDEDWFDEQRIDYAAWAAYRALRLLSEEQADAFARLTADVWVRWAAVIMAWPRNGEDERAFNARLVEKLAHCAPAVAAEWLDRALRREQKNEGSLFSLERIEAVSAPELDAVVLERARDRRLTPSQRESALAHLLARGSTEALGLARRLVVPSAVRAGGRRLELAARAAALLALTQPDADWVRTWRLFDIAPEFGEQVIGKLASDREVAIGPRLTEVQVAELFAWLVGRYPPHEDPADDEVHFVGAREKIGEWRNGLVQGLAVRGTPESVRVLDDLCRRFQNFSWLKFIRAQAAEAANRARWVPPSPEHVLEMSQRQEQRWITSGEALQTAVLAGLAAFQQRLVGLDPQASDLWDTASARPKGEQEIGRVLSRFLKDHLAQRGVFLVREPEARPSKSGAGRGESIDIWIEAVVGNRTTDASSVTVIVELKGSWNADLLTAMEDQLVDRYLEPPLHRHGIYVVAWFGRDRWTRRGDETRYAIAGRHRADELRGALEEQAAEIVRRRDVVVRAVVLDCSLPPERGATQGHA